MSLSSDISGVSCVLSRAKLPLPQKCSRGEGGPATGEAVVRRPQWWSLGLRTFLGVGHWERLAERSDLGA